MGIRGTCSFVEHRQGLRLLALPTERTAMGTTLDDALVKNLAERCSGTVLDPQHTDYHATRAVHNGLIDRMPALIVRCRTADDVVAALAAARRSEVVVSV